MQVVCLALLVTFVDVARRMLQVFISRKITQKIQLSSVMFPASAVHDDCNTSMYDRRSSISESSGRGGVDHGNVALNVLFTWLAEINHLSVGIFAVSVLI